MGMVPGMFIMGRMIIMPFRTMVIVSFRCSIMVLMAFRLIMTFDVLVVVI